jgi:starch-binding outer membrane protein, SusD/RagB family
MKTLLKNNIRIFWIVVLAFFTHSCGEDFLTQYPQDQLTSGTFYKTSDDYVAAINGVYDALVRRNEAEFIAMLDMATPFADCPGLRLDVYQIRRTNGVISINDSYWGSRTFWPIFYDVISRANTFLDNVDNENTQADKKIVDRTRGEALFLRAYAYFNLVQLFGDVPLITKVLSYDELLQPKVSKSEIYKQIITDLTEAAEVLPSVKEYRGTRDLGRATKGAAQALLGKTYLFMGDWPKAELWLKKVVDSNDYELEPYFVDLFWASSENGIESIFEIQYASIDPGGAGDRNRWPQYAGFHNNSKTYWQDGWNYVHPTEYYCDQFETVNGFKVRSEFVSQEQNTLYPGGINLNYNFYSSDPEFNSAKPYDIRDPRLKWTVWYDNTPYIQEDYISRSGCDGANFNKSYSSSTNHASVKYFTGKESPVDDSDMNMIVIRYADVLLMLAEAKLEQDKLSEAVELINQVRERPSVNMPTIQEVETIQGVSISNNQNNLRDYLREERYRELAFEWGHMFYDQIRWKIFDDEMEKFWVDGRDGFSFKSFSWDEKWWLWPIPDSEMNKNPNLSQNPGY